MDGTLARCALLLAFAIGIHVPGLKPCQRPLGNLFMEEEWRWLGMGGMGKGR